MRIGNDSGAMHPGAPTRLDRAVLAVVSGTPGHLVGTVMELSAALWPVVVGRVRARVRRSTRP